MKIKHTFLLTFVLGLVWTGYLFAYVFGPDPGMNGIFGAGQTCNSAGCHTGSPVNSGTGSVTIGGLPAAWTPGQAYPLTVTVQRTGSQLFGFQLSAVSDSGNQQAGTLAAGNGRAKIICGRSTAPNSIEVPCTTAGAIQYAEHSNATVITSTYSVNWTAPGNANFGIVRFNVAGNAANGDSTNQGDFIYTNVTRVNPAAAAPDHSILPFTLVDRGGVSVITDGSGATGIGYSRIQPAAGNTAPSGIAIFGLTQNGILVTETGVPASPLLTTARIYAEVGTFVNTGLAIANPGDVDAAVNFSLVDSTGNTFHSGSTTIPAKGQKASFLNEDPYFAPGTFSQATFTLTSNVPISVAALRGRYNERPAPDFLLTTLPVTDLSAPVGTGAVVLPHFAEGEGWTTQIVLVNPTDSAITGTLQFFDGASGAPIAVPSDRGTANTFNYSIPGKGSFKLATSGVSAPLKAGPVRVTPTAGAAAPSALVVFSFKNGNITVSEAGVPGIRGNAFRMYVEQTGAASIGAIQSGLAIGNTTADAASVTLELFALDGNPTGQLTTVNVPGNGEYVKFLHEIFPGLQFPVKGILRISGGGASGLSVVGLRGRYNQNADFLITTTPPSDEGSTPANAEQVFPQLVNGFGYTTQFILFSGSAGQASAGNLRFIKQAGTPFELNLN